MLSAQLILFGLMLVVVVGSLINPTLQSFGTQFMALLLLFYLLLQKIREGQKRKQIVRRVHDEETLLFLTTYLKPKLEDLIELVDREDNLELIKKQLQLTEREVDHFLEEKEKETQEDS